MKNRASCRLLRKVSDSIIVKLTDQLYFSFQSHAKALIYPVFDAADELIDIGRRGVIDIKNKSGMLVTDHGAPDAFSL